MVDHYLYFRFSLFDVWNCVNNYELFMWIMCRCYLCPYVGFVSLLVSMMCRLKCYQIVRRFYYPIAKKIKRITLYTSLFIVITEGRYKNKIVDEQHFLPHFQRTLSLFLIAHYITLACKQLNNNYFEPKT
jgi:hypothetical protein